MYWIPCHIPLQVVTGSAVLLPVLSPERCILLPQQSLDLLCHLRFSVFKNSDAFLGGYVFMFSDGGVGRPFHNSSRGGLHFFLILGLYAEIRKSGRSSDCPRCDGETLYALVMFESIVQKH